MPAFCAVRLCSFCALLTDARWVSVQGMIQKLLDGGGKGVFFMDEAAKTRCQPCDEEPEFDEDCLEFFEEPDEWWRDLQDGKMKFQAKMLPPTACTILAPTSPTPLPPPRRQC